MTMNLKPGRSLAVLSTILLAIGCDNQPKPPAMPPATVTVAHPLHREVVDWDEYTGHLEATQVVDLRARVGGYLEAADFNEGSIVEAGTVLFKLDPKPYQAELDRAVSQVEQAKAMAENAAAELVRIDASARKVAVRKRNTRTPSTPRCRPPPPSPPLRPPPKPPASISVTPRSKPSSAAASARKTSPPAT